MQRDIDFAIWCARKCLHLWDAPNVVKEWLKDPKQETAKTARTAAVVAAAEAAAGSAAAAARATAYTAAAAADVAVEVANAAAYAAKALHTTVTDLRFEYVKTLTDDELGKADDEWIEVATVEILNRM